MGGYTVAIFQAELFHRSHNALECVSNDLVQTVLEKINLIQLYEKIKHETNKLKKVRKHESKDALFATIGGN
jgi:hypothetical protein